MKPPPLLRLLCLWAAGSAGALGQSVSTAEPAPQILTPALGNAPAIHGPKVFGVRPGAPFFYTIPATGERPMTFSFAGLPAGLTGNSLTGEITGSVTSAGDTLATLGARNRHGTASRPLKIRVSDDIGLTPAMGWNSYNVWGANIDEARVLAAAKAMVDSGLAEHGYTYVNMDDGWQGARRGPRNSVQPNPEAFPNMKGLADRIHALHLKLGIYHTPWVSSYGRRIGGSSENALGTWDKTSMTAGIRNKKILPYAIGKYHFMTQDATQFAEWGIDYLKYDWAPVEEPETAEMYDALRATGRDIVLSLSNNASETLFSVVKEVSPHANSWRTWHDINDSWKAVKRNGFDQDKWAPFSRPGHFNDPDMLVVGVVGWGKPHPTHLLPDEQYSHVSLWCLMSAPLILGNDLTKLDEFTTSLLTNDEVLDLDQDSLGKQAVLVHRTLPDQGDRQVYAKPLDDGSWAVGFFNLGDAKADISVTWAQIGIAGRQVVRDLWRQKELGRFDAGFSAAVAPHGVFLVRLFPDKITEAFSGAGGPH